jgi:hypothetical protein
MTIPEWGERDNCYSVVSSAIKQFSPSDPRLTATSKALDRELDIESEK